MIERHELMKMARGCDHLWDDSGGDDVDNVAWIEEFANAILERAALECDDQWSKQDEFEGKQAVDCCSNAVRDLKTKE